MGSTPRGRAGPNVFCDLEDGKRVLREIKLLTFLVHENVLHIRDLLPPGQGPLLHRCKNEKNSKLKFFNPEVFRG